MCLILVVLGCVLNGKSVNSMTFLLVHVFVVLFFCFEITSERIGTAYSLFVFFILMPCSTPLSLLFSVFSVPFYLSISSLRHVRAVVGPRQGKIDIPRTRWRDRAVEEDSTTVLETQNGRQSERHKEIRDPWMRTELIDRGVVGNNGN